MNENLNLEKILKYRQKGTKLYSSALGEVEFAGINYYDKTYPIMVKTKDGTFSFTKQGKLYDIEQSECLLFPNKDQRDWSKFNHKKEELVPPYEFKDGDILSYQCGDFKNRTIYIFKYHKMMNTSFYVALGGDPDSTFRVSNKEGCALNGYNSTVRFATEEEKQKLFDAIKINGYKWNAETKTLEKLVEPKFKVGDKIVNSLSKYMGAYGHQCIISEITDDKYIFTDGSFILISNQDSWKLFPYKFDPKTLKPFDKVLMRDNNNDCWGISFFSHIMEDGKFYTLSTYFAYTYKYCIPYNDETKDLIGKVEEAPLYYRYWED